MPTPSIAVDCRGCGRSALGDPADFAPDTVVDDIKRLDHLLHKDNHISVHLMVAGIGTVCDDASIQDMQESMGDLLSVKTYPRGTHSIHNSVRDEFMADLLQVIEGTAAQKKELRAEL